MIVACVRTGTKYPFDYVMKLRNMVERHMGGTPYTMVCLTDQPDRCYGVEFIDITSERLPGWWAKMALLKWGWRATSRVLFFDLDTVIIRSLKPLATVRLKRGFGLPENFTRLSGNLKWPCKYSSAVMVIDPIFSERVWKDFDKNRRLMDSIGRYGDQLAIEQLYPNAELLQELLPPNYFMSYRALSIHVPNDVAIINFGGSHRPHNCGIPWVQNAWA